MGRCTATSLLFAIALSSPDAADQRAIPATRAPASLSIEAESLAAAAQTSEGKAVPQDMRAFGPGWSGDAQLFWGAGQIGAQLRLPFTVAVTGRHQIFLHFTRAPDFALVQASFDGAPPISFNGYAPTVGRDRALLAMRDLTAGPHEVLLKVAAKDGQSRGLNVGIDRIELQPVATDTTASPAASMVEAAKIPIPVIHAPQPGAAPQAAILKFDPEPLSMEARAAVVKQATAMSISGPEQPLRLTPANPRILKRAALSLSNGFFTTDMYTDGWFGVAANASLSLSFFQVEPNRPHLLDCGVQIGEPADVEISSWAQSPTGQTYKPPEVTKISLPTGNQHVLAVFIPAKDSFSVYMRPAGTAGFSVKFCELTPFK